VRRRRRIRKRRKRREGLGWLMSSMMGMSRWIGIEWSVQHFV
jgi:hypothetical protein